MASDQDYKHEPLLKSPWRQVCGCMFFLMFYIVIMAYCSVHGYTFHLSLSFDSLIFVAYLIAVALMFFLPQSILDRIVNKWFIGEKYPLKRKIPTERVERDIPTDRSE
jgi:antibiotic biosynthesis monooxygenase (ABM) superfamily enzyme